MGGRRGVVGGGGVVTGPGLVEQLATLDETHPEAAAMFRELMVAAAVAERAEAGGAEAVLAEYRERCGGVAVLDVEQIAEVRAWLASR